MGNYPQIKFRASVWVLLACLVFAAAARAQDPLLDSTDAPVAARWSWFGDLVLRYDHVRGLPSGRTDLERGRGRLRLGGEWAVMPTLQIGAAIELAQGTDSNHDNRINNDNERSDGGNLDQLFLRWKVAEASTVLLGKAPLPLELSPLVWDQDLRPAGVSIDHAFNLGDFDRLQLTAGWFAGQHLYDDRSRIGAVQLAWRWHEGAPTRAGVILSWLDFSNLQQLTTQGLSRTNLKSAGRLVSDFRLLDLQLIGHTEVGTWPLEARLDLLRNTGADAARDGARFSLVLGDRFQTGGWEFGFAQQRSQRDAAMAAFSADDWWFHSFAHGVMPWVGYGFAERWSARLAGFHELRDGLSEHTDRILLDVESRW